MSPNSYWIDVSHEGLHAYRRITGRDRHVVEAKAAAQRAVWEEKWAKMQQREKALFTKEQKKDSAASRTQKAVQALSNIDDTLLTIVDRDCSFNWDQLKDHSHFDTPSPVQTAKQSYPVKPEPGNPKYTPKLSILDRLVTSRKQKKFNESKQLFEFDLDLWKTEATNIDHQNASSEANYKEQLKQWESEKQAFKASQKARNAEVDGHKASYLAKSADSVVDYCDFVLSNSEYPDSFPRSWQFEYNPETRLLIVEYSLPNIDALPKLKEVKYVATKDEFAESFLSDSALEKMYDALLYKITLRSFMS